MTYHGGAPRVRKSKNLQTGASIEGGAEENPNAIVIDTQKMVNLAIEGMITSVTAIAIGQAIK